MTNYEHADAPDNIELYLTKSIGIIDKSFGKGYAKANPALVAAFVTACERDHHTDATAILVSNAITRIGFGECAMQGRGIIEGATEMMADKKFQGMELIAEAIRELAESKRE